MHPEDRVLVGVVNNLQDFERARDKGWYRVPVKHAPPSTTESHYLAFYFTKAFGEERWAIHWYAPIRGHELKRRSDLLPDEPDHPRAARAYYVLQLGPLERGGAKGRGTSEYFRDPDGSLMEFISYQ